MFKKQSEERFLANMLLVSQALFLAISGAFFISSPTQETTSPTYQLMTSLMSLDAWGVVLLIGGLFLLTAAFQTGRTRYLSMLIGGLLGAILIGLYASAAAEGTVNFLLPARYALFAVFNLVIGAVGGMGLWSTKRLL